MARGAILCGTKSPFAPLAKGGWGDFKIGFLGKAKIFYRFQGFKATVPMPAVLISFLRDSAVAVYWLTGFHSIQPWEPNFSQALI